MVRADAPELGGRCVAAPGGADRGTGGGVVGGCGRTSMAGMLDLRFGPEAPGLPLSAPDDVVDAMLLGVLLSFFAESVDAMESAR